MQHLAKWAQNWLRLHALKLRRKWIVLKFKILMRKLMFNSRHFGAKSWPQLITASALVVVPASKLNINSLIKILNHHFLYNFRACNRSQFRADLAKCCIYRMRLTSSFGWADFYVEMMIAHCSSIDFKNESFFNREVCE